MAVARLAEGEEEPSSAVAAALAPLLRARGCRLQSLSVVSIDWTGLADPPPPDPAAAAPAAAGPARFQLTPFEDFAEALSENASLRQLRLADATMGLLEHAVLAGALATRAAKLDVLELRNTNATAYEDGSAAGQGAGDSHPALLPCVNLLLFWPRTPHAQAGPCYATTLSRPHHCVPIRRALRAPRQRASWAAAGRWQLFH